MGRVGRSSPTASSSRREGPLLTLDRGNTTLDAMLHGSGAPGCADRRARLLPGDGAALAAFLGGTVPAAAVGATVVPGGLEAAAQKLAELGVALPLAGRELPCPLPLDYQTPATLGADRWLGALGALRRCGRAVVIDCGSAVTVDLVEECGTFRGGAIAPGLRALAAGLRQLTPHLPAPALAPEPAPGPGPTPGESVAMPPRSTAAAVTAGVLLGWCGGIERLCAEMLRCARGPATVVLTGGDAETYLQHGRLRPLWVPDLVHRGLAALCAEGLCGS